MTAQAVLSERPILEAQNLHLVSPTGRTLVADLNLSLGREQVALMGRNGVGKSVLLDVLAGATDPARGRVRCDHRRTLVRQELDEQSRESGGERRRRHLARAFEGRSELLLLDEPSQDLDAERVAWLTHHLGRYEGALIVASHRPAILRLFNHFFVMDESGCRYFRGSFLALQDELQQRHERGERAYLQRLNVLMAKERRCEKVSLRKARKKNLGRIHEEGRAPSRGQLMGKKGYAQVSQGKAAKLRNKRVQATRAWALAARRALAVQLPLSSALPQLPTVATITVSLRNVEVRRDERLLCRDLTYRIARQRIGVVGPNGAGKSTLLEVIAGERAVTTGRAVVAKEHVGYIGQRPLIGAAAWCDRDSLVELLLRHPELRSLDDIAKRLVVHHFPLALAERSLGSLSPGEQIRALLIHLSGRTPAIELLVLDEPTTNLDFWGRAELVRHLRHWKGGLVVASHDHEFLREVGITEELALDGRGGSATHTLV